jgi:tetratricopeptide (TPR) repeat protein
MSQGNLTKAIELYVKTIELDPNIGMAYNNIGRIYHTTGNATRAIYYYKKAARLDYKPIQDWLKKNGYDW